MSDPNQQRLDRLTARFDRSFQVTSVSQVIAGRKAIIGPRSDLLDKDANEAREALRQGRSPTPKQQAALELSIRLQRPAPAIQAERDTELPAEGNWLAGPWNAFKSKLREMQSGIARIDRIDDPDPAFGSGSTSLGSGFLVAPDVLLTASHVVDALSFGTGKLERGQAVVDFRGYLRSPGTDQREVLEVINSDAHLDLSLLRLSPQTANNERLHILSLDGLAPTVGGPVCVVGYPLEDPRNSIAFVAIIFSNHFGVKRAALGEIIAIEDEVCFHDCSTLGGNSGSPIFNIHTGLVCGVHLGGRAFIRNDAIPVSLARKFVTQSLNPSSLCSKTQRNKKMADKRPSFDKYFLELQDKDPDLKAEMDAAMDEMASNESTEGGANQFTRETIVLTKGRPVLDIKQGAAIIEFNEVESQIWKSRLVSANSLLLPNIPSVGRIEVANHPRGVEWLGTGWLIRDNIVVTNRHVAEVFGESNGQGFMFRPGFDGSPMQSNIDFLEEFDDASSHEFPLFKIMHIEKGSGPDLAFLRIEPVNGQALPPPVKLSSVPIQNGEQVAVIGYPARDPFFPDQALMNQIFNNRFDKKRLAPGLVTGITADRIYHDCSTLGGNSGGEVVSLKTGLAVALHFAGTLFTKNHAVPIDVVASRLDDVLSSRPERPNTRSSSSGADNGLTLQSASGSSTSVRIIEATIPIKVRIELGDICAASPLDVHVSASPKAQPSVPVAIDLDADDDLFETTEARPEDYTDREGYQEEFLGEGFEVPLPELTENLDDILEFDFNGSGQSVLNYTHFSVVMSKSRRMCRFSACNIDGKTSQRTKRSGWQFDPRIPKEAQIMKECYGNAPKFSRGHMTRREDPAWGPDAELGNRDSMHVTNTVPQIQILNGGVWLALEDYALQNARKDKQKISVFTGPFLANNDPFRFKVKVPITFWKVIAFIHDETGELCATGYTMSQKSFIGEEEFVFGRHENNQRPIKEIERRAGISFGPLAELDPLKDQSEGVSELLTQTNQIRFF